MLAKGGECRLPCLIPELRKLSSFTSKYDVSFRFLVDALYEVEEIHFCSWCTESLFMNGLWILSNTFFCISLYDMTSFPFNLLIWCVTMIDFWILNLPCILGINHIWFICCWIQLANILLRILFTYRSSWEIFLWFSCVFSFLNGYKSVWVVYLIWVLVVCDFLKKLIYFF